VSAWLASRGMACSVYAAQYLLEGLFEHGDGVQAFADHGPTIAAGAHGRQRNDDYLEAWDQKYKPNQTGTRVGGGAAICFRASCWARGRSPWLAPSQDPPHPARWRTRRLGPHPARAGTDRVDQRGELHVEAEPPPGMTARVGTPGAGGSRASSAAQRPSARRAGSYWLLDEDVEGSVTLDVR